MIATRMPLPHSRFAGRKGDGQIFAGAACANTSAAFSPATAAATGAAAAVPSAYGCSDVAVLNGPPDCRWSPHLSRPPTTAVRKPAAGTSRISPPGLPRVQAQASSSSSSSSSSENESCAAFKTGDSNRARAVYEQILKVALSPHIFNAQKKNKHVSVGRCRMLAINHRVALPTYEALSRVGFVQASVPREQWSVPTDCKRFEKKQAEEGLCERHCTSCDNTANLQGRKRARPADDVTQAATSAPVGVAPSRARPLLVMPPLGVLTRAGHLVSAAHAVAQAASKPVGECASAKWQKTTVPATVPDDKAAAPGQRGLADEINDIFDYEHIFDQDIFDNDIFDNYIFDNNIFRDVPELEDTKEALAEFGGAH